MGGIFVGLCPECGFAGALAASSVLALRYP